MGPTNGNGVWKYIATVAVSVLVGMAVQALREPKDLITKEEMTMHLTIIQVKLDTLTNEVAALKTTVNRIAQKVGIEVVAPHPVNATIHSVAVSSRRSP